MFRNAALTLFSESSTDQHLVRGSWSFLVAADTEVRLATKKAVCKSGNPEERKPVETLLTKRACQQQP